MKTTSHGDMRFGPPARKKYRITTNDVGDILTVTGPDGRKGIPGERVLPSLLAIATKTMRKFRTADRRHPDGVTYRDGSGELRGIDLRKVTVTIDGPEPKKAPDDELVRLRARLNALFPDETIEERAKRVERERIAAFDVTVPETAAPSPTRITEVS